MLANFKQMPLVLKILTLSFIAGLAFLTETLVPGSTILVFGRNIAVRQWWASGVGAACVAVVVLLGLSSILMIRRAQIGRCVYVVGLVLGVVSLIVAGHTFESGHYLVPAIVSNGVLTCVVACYLYFSANVRRYFCVTMGTSA